MRLVASLAIALSVGTLALGTQAVSAAQDKSQDRSQDKYCVQGTNMGYPGNCAFSSYAQCMATASGTNDGCGINPRYAYTQQRSGHPYRAY